MSQPIFTPRPIFTCKPIYSRKRWWYGWDVKLSYLEHPHNNKCNFIEVLKSNWIYCKLFIFTKRIDFSEITFSFPITSYKKVGVADHTQTLYFKFFDLFVPIKYKIGLLKAQVLKSYWTVVVKKLYRVRGFLSPPSKPK